MNLSKSSTNILLIDFWPIGLSVCTNDQYEMNQKHSGKLSVGAPEFKGKT
ncbi:hypothetical protein N7E81_15610 [Reichenbachiella carrageenanivorans]|uniref:Uncharacterized protein n=1 Tax=Reichenbachiella carrageenanivorans TaxID=2979869 RepID=A0ABY6D4K6_9BACT|nr:hypothetical protein [Reichenbachiella carrageenanivorans]UXX78785.1 hypothetical protein N7E81_15610 [Reichenbachiella carrageenanivorans]